MTDKTEKWSAGGSNIQMAQMFMIERQLDIAYRLKELAGKSVDIQDIDKIIKDLKNDMEVIKTRPVSLNPITSKEREQNALSVAKIIVKNQIRKIDVDVTIE